MSKNVEKMEFQSEAKQVLELMIHSVYSNPDIFVRELISNASDALDKLRVKSLTDTALSELAKNPRIDLTIDRDAKTLTFSDNGIGMTHDELISYLGTIAKSGTKEFMQAMQEAQSGSDLIGQFGVGFYSSFIAADRVTVDTRKAGTAESWKWESAGDGTYTVSEGERSSNGTTITLYMKKADPASGGDELKDYLSEWTLRSIIKQYSDFVSYPIYVKDVSKKADEEKPEEEKKEEPVNSMKALWTRPEKDVSDEEYKEFYRHISHDWDEPLDRISYKAEGSSEFRALLYIPSRPPMDLYYRDAKQGVQLYIRRVFIMEDCKELIPEYLRFIRGVVDSEDLSLNVSREILQKDRQTALIKSSLTRKILDFLGKMKQEKAEEYAKFWQMFGNVLKEGIVSDFKNRDHILKLCAFDSSNGGTTSLEDYAAHMAAGQTKIYYLTGAPLESLKESPKLEAFRQKKIEVLLLGEPVDELWIGSVGKFEDHEFLSAASENLELPEGESTDTAAKEELEKSGFAASLKEALSGLVEDVKISSRLVDSPVCYVQKDGAPSAQMRKFLKSIGQEMPEEKKVMEVNPSHPLIKKIAAEAKDGGAQLAEWGKVLMGLASIADGEPVPDGQEFTQMLTKILEK
ncbi:MAG: molecular chaperone HtpG [Pyramidobacter sp.]|nr:molecular chaperone HtpG [Pyramidobacter sp.]